MFRTGNMCPVFHFSGQRGRRGALRASGCAHVLSPEQIHTVSVVQERKRGTRQSDSEGEICFPGEDHPVS